MGYSLQWRIRGDSSRKGYLFHSSAGIWKGREIGHFLRKGTKSANRCILWLWRSRENVLVLWFIESSELQSWLKRLGHFVFQVRKLTPFPPTPRRMLGVTSQTPFTYLEHVKDLNFVEEDLGGKSCYTCKWRFCWKSDFEFDRKHATKSASACTHTEDQEHTESSVEVKVMPVLHNRNSDIPSIHLKSARLLFLWNMEHCG